MVLFYVTATRERRTLTKRFLSPRKRRPPVARNRRALIAVFAFVLVLGVLPLVAVLIDRLP